MIQSKLLDRQNKMIESLKKENSEEKLLIDQSKKESLQEDILKEISNLKKVIEDNSTERKSWWNLW